MDEFNISDSLRRRIMLSIIGVALLTAFLCWFSVINLANGEKAISLEGSTVPMNTISLRELPDTIVGEDEATDVVKLEGYDIIKNDFELLKNKDAETVAKYFGMSDVFSPDAISDRVKVTEISLISSTVDGDNTVVDVHICTIDYNLMNSDYANYLEVETNRIEGETEADEAVTEKTSSDSIEAEVLSPSEIAKKRVAGNLIDGRYDVCYNIPVVITDSSIVITEILKQALTGNWYMGVGTVLESVECIENVEDTE